MTSLQEWDIIRQDMDNTVSYVTLYKQECFKYVCCLENTFILMLHETLWVETTQDYINTNILPVLGRIHHYL